MHPIYIYIPLTITLIFNQALTQRPLIPEPSPLATPLYWRIRLYYWVVPTVSLIIWIEICYGGETYPRDPPGSFDTVILQMGPSFEDTSKWNAIFSFRQRRELTGHKRIFQVPF